MKPNRFERSYRDTTPLVHGAYKDDAQLTPLSRIHGRIHLNCDNCNIVFTKHSSACKGYKNYCSRTCASEGRKIPKTCIICGTRFKGSWRKTCSADCKTEAYARIRRGKTCPRLSYAYVGFSCENCGKHCIQHNAWFKKAENHFCSRRCNALFYGCIQNEVTLD